MKLGLQKCKTRSIQQGKWEITEYEMEDGKITGGMQEEDTYKYLGIKQA
jgi:hypothetical protein